MECESENLDKSYADEKMENGKTENHINGTLDKENSNPNVEKKASKDTQRRHDEPSELSFEIFPENAEEKIKRQQIEKALEKDSNTTLEQWRQFARSEYGLINDDLRQKVWPLLLSVDVTQCDPVPSLEELSKHPEYNQVVLDVNRSLKRFPPGIPLAKRLALQDQLTAIILRVISKYPHLSYYQGYHDVAVTFLLVCGDEIAFHIMEILSTDHLVECMQKTFEIVQKRLLLIYAIVWRENKDLYEYLERSQCGLLFALPWYLTWFGHSLNHYRSVVRLYDYFLASEPLLPLYVTAAIVLYREEDIYREECDRASLHCLLSQLPDELPFEYLLIQSEKLYAKYPPHNLHKDIEKIIEREQKIREEEDKVFETRRQIIQRKRQPVPTPQPFIYKLIPRKLVLHRRSIFVSTAFIVIGIFAYYYKTHTNFNVDVIR
ncbi:TBC1 domain family member 20 [Chironomus tepperi]|uniref:TBC1 domain family member 20 n=1 Tax=Chironomus tepperi TaxID=113505 RepID=UPI00391F0CE3